MQEGQWRWRWRRRGGEQGAGRSPGCGAPAPAASPHGVAEGEQEAPVAAEPSPQRARPPRGAGEPTGLLPARPELRGAGSPPAGLSACCGTRRCLVEVTRGLSSRILAGASARELLGGPEAAVRAWGARPETGFIWRATCDGANLAMRYSGGKKTFPWRAGKCCWNEELVEYRAIAGVFVILLSFQPLRPCLCLSV